ncbi:MAG: GatB/YqeY domain-containing protein [Desulfobacterota bacterium]|nr:GatB/YqeY domain-containing protein [Thermodesulfobacteriota bacterium]
MATSLVEKIAQDLKEAMKAKDEFRLSCLRVLKAAVTNEQGRRTEPLKDSDVLAVIQSLVRKGQEAAAEFRKGHRDDVAAKEEAEVKILSGYLPVQLAPAEIEAVIREVMAEVSASGPKDLGKVMKAAMARLAGKVQGKEVNEIAKRLLG